MNIKEIQKYLIDNISELKYIKEPKELYEPLDYMMALGGKRTRPLMVLIAHSLFKKDYKKSIHAALAIETFHNFSLIHDDIMDEAPLRRGMPTVHEKWNHNIAILSGDVMLVKAYEHLCQYDNELLPYLLKLFNQTAIEVCEGQQLDMLFEKAKDVSINQYIKMIELKTAVLLACSLKMGALIAGAAHDDADKLYEFGRLMGIAFQLRDDYLDVYANPEKFGKQVGGDIIANKKTLLWLEAQTLANQDQLAEFNHWESQEVFRAEDKVNAITKIYNELNIPKITEDKINEFANKAFQILDSIHADVEAKGILLKLSEELLIRES